MFEAGDKVICVRDDIWEDELEIGKEYTIFSFYERRVGGIFVSLEEIPNIEFKHSRFKLKEKDMFTLEDIKEGYLVEDRYGYLWLVTKKKSGGLALANEIDCAVLSDGVLDEIVEVYDLSEHYSGGLFNVNNRKLLWERKETKEMTVAEIEKELGYSIKVVK